MPGSASASFTVPFRPGLAFAKLWVRVLAGTRSVALAAELLPGAFGELVVDDAGGLVQLGKLLDVGDGRAGEGPFESFQCVEQVGQFLCCGFGVGVGVSSEPGLHTVEVFLFVVVICVELVKGVAHHDVHVVEASFVAALFSWRRAGGVVWVCRLGMQ